MDRNWSQFMIQQKHFILNKYIVSTRNVLVFELGNGHRTRNISKDYPFSRNIVSSGEDSQ